MRWWTKQPEAWAACSHTDPRSGAGHAQLPRLGPALRKDIGNIGHGRVRHDVGPSGTCIASSVTIRSVDALSICAGLGSGPAPVYGCWCGKKTNPKPEKIRHQSTHGTLPASNTTCAIDAGDVITPGVMAQVSSMCRRCEIRKREGVVQRLTAKPRSRLMRATWARSRIVNVRPKRASISSRHCSSIDGGRATTIRSTRRRSSSSRAISPASIVLPRPKRGGPPDATPSTAGHLASTYRSDSQARPDARDAGLTWPLP